MIKYILIVLSFGVFAQNTSYATDLPQKKAVLRTLDKQMGRAETMTVKVGEPFHFGSLDGIVRACYTRPENEEPENSMFIEVTENQKDETGQVINAKIFTGWMFSSSLSISAMEHPTYDLWVVNCTD